MANRGAPLGNQNALKHGFYSKFLTETEKQGMEEAEEIEGLDHELALLRVKLCHLLKDNSDRIDLQIKAVNMIARMARTRHIITPEDKGRYKDALSGILREVAIPLGVKFIPVPSDEKWEESLGEGLEPEGSETDEI